MVLYLAKPTCRLVCVCLSDARQSPTKLFFNRKRAIPGSFQYTLGLIRLPTGDLSSVGMLYIIRTLGWLQETIRDTQQAIAQLQYPAFTTAEVSYDRRPLINDALVTASARLEVDP
jgi:hypothetical protein